MFPPDKLSSGLLGDETCQSGGEGLVIVASKDLRFRRSIIKKKKKTGEKINKALPGRGIAARRALSLFSAER